MSAELGGTSSVSREGGVAISNSALGAPSIRGRSWSIRIKLVRPPTTTPAESRQSPCRSMSPGSGTRPDVSGSAGVAVGGS